MNNNALTTWRIEVRKCGVSFADVNVSARVSTEAIWKTEKMVTGKKDGQKKVWQGFTFLARQVVVSQI